MRFIGRSVCIILNGCDERATAVEFQPLIGNLPREIGTEIWGWYINYLGRILWDGKVI